jgi:hypothetical protein
MNRYHIVDWSVDANGDPIELNDPSAPPWTPTPTSPPSPVPPHFGDCKGDRDWRVVRAWRQMVHEQLRENPPMRRNDEWWINHRGYHDAVYTHSQLRNLYFRRKILRHNPDTLFRYSEMTDANVGRYWYVGVPMRIYPKYLFHKVRSHAARSFDKYGSFIAQLKTRYGNSIFENSPPPLVILVADQIRRSEYIRLKGEAVRAVQLKYSIFETLTDLEDEDIQAAEIYDETLPEFLDRMGPEFLRLKFCYGLF